MKENLCSRPPECFLEEICGVAASPKIPSCSILSFSCSWLKPVAGSAREEG